MGVFITKKVIQIFLPFIIILGLSLDGMWWVKNFPARTQTRNWMTPPPPPTFYSVTSGGVIGSRARATCLEQFPLLYNHTGHDKLLLILAPHPPNFIGFAKLPSPPPSEGRKKWLTSFGCFYYPKGYPDFPPIYNNFGFVFKTGCGG